LAEKLGMTVTRLVNEMTIAEYFNWMKFYLMRHKEQNKNPNNIMELDENDIVKQVMNF
jgi:hypothetical protein